MGATNSTPQPKTLITPKGSLLGILQTDTTTSRPICTRYTRIPYALPPTGSRRFQRPHLLPSDFNFSNPSTCPQPQYAHSAAALENPHAALEELNVQDEDCLYLNIWVPAGDVPEGGWPVQLYIYGGWLQVGDAMQSAPHDPFDLLKTHPRIIISPTYRLNIFGYLSSSSLLSPTESSSGNYGFWDQRLALEWTHQNISFFSGNPDNISVGGLSAGAHSTIFQLHYDTHLPSSQRIIKRVYLYSNAIGVQPKPSTSPECEEQYTELVTALNISSSLSSEEKLAALRRIPAKDLIATIKNLEYHTFRAVTDNAFISPTFLRSIHDGSFTTALSKNGIKILLGEVANEELLYRMVNPATSYSNLELQLNNYYPSAVSQALMKSYDLPKGDDEDEWAAVGGKILGDAQVHAVIRGFTHSLLNPPMKEGVVPLPTSSVYKYRIAYRSKNLDEWIDPKVKCCHASDIPIWWASGQRAVPGWTEKDTETVTWLLDAFWGFLKGEDVKWGTRKVDDVLEINSDGEVRTVKDDGWKEGLRVWGIMKDAQL